MAKYIHRVRECEETLKPITILLQSNDYIARALVLRIIGCFASVLSKSIQIQYSVLIALNGNEHEFNAAFFSANALAHYSTSFSCQLTNAIMEKMPLEDVRAIRLCYLLRYSAASFNEGLHVYSVLKKEIIQTKDFIVFKSFAYVLTCIAIKLPHLISDFISAIENLFILIDSAEFRNFLYRCLYQIHVEYPDTILPINPSDHDLYWSLRLALRQQNFQALNNQGIFDNIDPSNIPLSLISIRILVRCELSIDLFKKLIERVFATRNLLLIEEVCKSNQHLLLKIQALLQFPDINLSSTLTKVLRKVNDESDLTLVFDLIKDKVDENILIHFPFSILLDYDLILSRLPFNTSRVRLYSLVVTAIRIGHYSLSLSLLQRIESDKISSPFSKWLRVLEFICKGDYSRAIVNVSTIPGMQFQRAFLELLRFLKISSASLVSVKRSEIEDTFYDLSMADKRILQTLNLNSLKFPKYFFAPHKLYEIQEQCSFQEISQKTLKITISLRIKFLIPSPSRIKKIAIEILSNDAIVVQVKLPFTDEQCECILTLPIDSYFMVISLIDKNDHKWSTNFRKQIYSI